MMLRLLTVVMCFLALAAAVNPGLASISVNLGLASISILGDASLPPARVGDSSHGLNLTLTMLPPALAKQHTSRCLDGSPYGYYIRRSASQSKKWVFFLEGGGLCVEGVDCKKRMKTALGSSKYWSQSFVPGTDGGVDILDDNATLNAGFHDFESNVAWAGRPLCFSY
jgi:hypothetical protein